MSDSNAVGASSPTTESTKPNQFEMVIQGCMLEWLGINMYTSLGKCLVEFAANAYDCDSPEVEFSIPFDAITAAQAELKALRAASKAKVKTEVELEQTQNEPPATAAAASENSIDAAPANPGADALAAQGPAQAAKALPDVSSYETALPDHIKIVVKDKGHGMSPADIAGKFLPINRNRRQSQSNAQGNAMSESGLRRVMGRKGLGKLAGFGIAGLIVIDTKRKGADFRTTFTLDAEELGKANDLKHAKVPATYTSVGSEEFDSSGTTITLSKLKPDAVKTDLTKVQEILADAFFAIDPGNFSMKLAGSEVPRPPVDYDFIYPPAAAAATDKLTDATVVVQDNGALPIRYAVKFRKPGQHLAAGKRGARIYCNKRLAAGPSLFRLGTGMHNFHAQDYLECIVIADSLDELGIDFINTNRSQLREDNDVVDALIAFTTEQMKQALAAHSKHRDNKVEHEILQNPQGKLFERNISTLPAKSRAPAKKLLKVIANEFGVGTPQFEEMAPLILQTMNATETLIRLFDLKADPKTIETVAEHLKSLSEIEKSDALKLYRGRKNGILALRKLTEEGEAKWKLEGIEGKLQDLLKQNPWLIRPEFSNYLTSDENLATFSSKLAKVLGVDKFSQMTEAEGKADKKRPDLTFVMSDTSVPNVVTVVELKSPSIPLEEEHLSQLKAYLRKVEQYCKTELRKHVAMKGYLIGAMPDHNSKAEGAEALRYEIEKNAGKADWEVIGLEKLLAIAQQIHIDSIRHFEAELNEDSFDEQQVGDLPKVPEPALPPMHS